MDRQRHPPGPETDKQGSLSAGSGTTRTWHREGRCDTLLLPWLPPTACAVPRTAVAALLLSHALFHVQPHARTRAGWHSAEHPQAAQSSPPAPSHPTPPQALRLPESLRTKFGVEREKNRIKDLKQHISSSVGTSDSSLFVTTEKPGKAIDVRVWMAPNCTRIIIITQSVAHGITKRTTHHQRNGPLSSTATPIGGQD